MRLYKVTRLAGVAVLTAALCLIMIPAAGATSWARIEPEQIMSRSDVVVVGRYKMPLLSRPAMGPWLPVKFKVERYYQGSGGPVISTAIDAMDTGVVSEEQRRGYKYLLFLAKNKGQGGKLLPVDGPGGMIKIARDGSAHPPLTKDAPKFAKFLESASLAAAGKNQETDSTGQPRLLLAAMLIVIIAAAIMILRQRRN